MDIQGETVKMTPGEAEFIQHVCGQLQRMPGLAQRILDARVAYAEPWLEPEELERVPMVNAAVYSEIAMVGLVAFSNRLHLIAKEHARGDDGQEVPVVGVTMKQREKRNLLLITEAEHEYAVTQLDTDTHEGSGFSGIADNAWQSVVEAGLISPEEADEVERRMLDPDFIQHMDQQNQFLAHEDAVTAANIIMALREDLGIV